MAERIWLSPPHMSGTEIGYVDAALSTKAINQITNFEQELSKYLHGDSVAALSSGTAAIHLALIILGVKADDEVICSSFTFAGSCNPIIYQGAKPVFIDSETETWNMSPDLLEQAIKDRIIKTGKKPKAIIVVHLYGMPAKMDAISKIASHYQIPIIEDAAEAVGSLYKGKKCGTLGDIGILSFNGNKIITTSGGGALVSKNAAWVERARFLATQARDNAPHYQHTEIGYNYRLSNVCAGIGRGQLQVLEERVQQRRAIFKRYQQMLPEGIQTLPEPDGFISNRWLTTVVFKSYQQRENVRMALEEHNIESRPLWKPMHLQPVFAEMPSYLNGISEMLFNCGLCLPSGSNLTEEQQQRIIDILKEIKP